MDVNKILKADFLDIIFEGRNKQYGAYELRKTYNSRLTIALISTAVIALLIFIGSVFANIRKDKVEDIEVLDTQMAEIKKDAPPPPPPPPPPPLPPPPPPEINQVKFTPPKIVKDEEVKADEKIEEIKEDQVISTVTVKSDNTKQIVDAPVVEKGVLAAPVVEEDVPFTKVEVEAKFNGNWSKYLQNNLNAEVPINNGAPEGKYTVMVKFIVSKDGSISNVEATTNPGFGMAEEAIKVVKKGPKWIPAIQNGRSVTAYRFQPITFVVEEQW